MCAPLSSRDDLLALPATVAVIASPPSLSVTVRAGTPVFQGSLAVAVATPVRTLPETVTTLCHQHTSRSQ